jgi:hypothetical protein
LTTFVNVILNPAQHVEIFSDLLTVGIRGTGEEIWEVGFSIKGVVMVTAKTVMKLGRDMAILISAM